jgi:hypothetical protein
LGEFANRLNEFNIWKDLADAFLSAKAKAETEPFQLTAHQPKAMTPEGDVNAMQFGTALQTMRTELGALIDDATAGSSEELEKAARAEHAEPLLNAFNNLISSAFDPEAAALLSGKQYEGLIAEGQQTLKEIQMTVGAVIMAK